MSMLLCVTLAVLAADPPQPSAPRNVAFDMGGEPRKMAAEVAALRAVRALAAEKFHFAEIGPDGAVRGYSDGVAVLVVPYRFPDGQVLASVFAAGWEKAETERIRVKVVEEVLNGAAPGENAPRSFGSPVPPLLRKAPHLAGHLQERVGAPIIRHFATAAAIAMEKLGMTVGLSGPVRVLGSGGRVVGAVVIVPTANAQVVGIACVAAAAQSSHAEDSSRALVAGVVKILYE